MTTTGMDLLRFATVGSVDDGKSTLIGRLLFDSRQLFDDQVDAVQTASRNRGAGEFDLSYITDGLRAEREQGITIDVAYRYAATPNRKFVIADCPGHVQYTSNMATGASTADLALVLVDATAGLKEQTRRHVCIAALLGVDQLVVAANKMDAIDWDQAAYAKVVEEITELADQLSVRSLTVIPISALEGDNVVERSDKAPWYQGPSVLEALEQAPPGGWAQGHGSSSNQAFRFPVQWILRQEGGGRHYAGMVNGGGVKVGDEVVILPKGARSTVRGLSTADGPLDEVAVGYSIAIDLADDLDVTRGDMIAAAASAPEPTNEFTATVCWFSDQPLAAGSRLRLKHTSKSTPARVVAIEGRVDVNSLDLDEADHLVANDIGLVEIKTADPIAVDPYHANRITGSFVLVDEKSNATVAAGMVGRPVFAAGS